jgi:hypothetical protein
MSKRKKKPSDVRKVLANVVKVLNEGTQSSGDLWNILSALRGPDNNLGVLKGYTTARIRGIIGLESSDALILSIMDSPLDADEKNKRDIALSSADSHFLEHYGMAKLSIRRVYKWDLGEEVKYKPREEDTHVER